MLRFEVNLSDKEVASVFKDASELPQDKRELTFIEVVQARVTCYQIQGLRWKMVRQGFEVLINCEHLFDQLWLIGAASEIKTETIFDAQFLSNLISSRALRTAPYVKVRLDLTLGCQ